MAPIQTVAGALKAGVIFALLGPFVGASPWAIGVFVAERDGASMIWPLVLVFGFIFGLGPAVAAGALFLAWVRTRIRLGDVPLSRSRLALWGAMSGFLCTFVPALISWAAGPALLFALEGAVAGAACAALCQPLIRPRCGQRQASAAGH